MNVGDPLDPAVEVGPLVAERQRDRVEGYFKIGQDEGAKIAVGGGRPSGLDQGWFVDPTVFVDVDNSMRIAQERSSDPSWPSFPMTVVTRKPWPSPTTPTTACAGRYGPATPPGASRWLVGSAPAPTC